MEWLTESFHEMRTHPKRSMKEFLQLLLIMSVCGGMIFLSAILSGCSSSARTTVRGKATIITVDTTTVSHNGTISFKKGIFNK